MRVTATFVTILYFGLSLMGTSTPARSQEASLAQDPNPAQSAPQAQRRGGDRLPGVFGKLTAIHDQSIEVTKQNGDVVTVKINANTQFRKERETAKLTDFKVGDMVGVRGEENPDHTWTAETIGSRPNGGFGGGPGGAAAQGGGPGGMPQMGVLGQDYVVGEVKAIDAPKLTVLRPDNVTQTIELNEETSLRKGRDSVTMADIQVGDHVFVRGAMNADAFQPKSVNVIAPEQWKRMQETGMIGGPPANPPKDNNQPQKPPEPPH